MAGATMEPEFAEAFLHRLAPRFDEADPWSGHLVLGARLRPYSLWHQFVLEFIESPLLGLNVTANRVDLAEALARAVRICRGRMGDADVRPWKSWRMRWALLGGLEKQLKLFREYVEDFQQMPDYHVIPRKGSGSGEARGQAPEFLKIVAGVIEVTRCSRREAWEMPQGEARWWHALSLRKDGLDLDFNTAEARAERDAIKEQNPELHAQLVKAAAQFRAGGMNLTSED